MDKRGAYFFVIDALIAGAVLLAAMMFIFSTYSSKPDRDTTLRGSEDFLQYISSTKVREYESSVVINMTADKNITSLDNTLIEQMVEFYCLQKNDALNQFAADLATKIISPERGLLMSTEGVCSDLNPMKKRVIYNSTLHKSFATLNSSALVISAKRMSYKLMNETTIFGPVWIEVKVWV